VFDNERRIERIAPVVSLENAVMHLHLVGDVLAAGRTLAQGSTVLSSWCEIVRYVRRLAETDQMNEVVAMDRFFAEFRVPSTCMFIFMQWVDERTLSSEESVAKFTRIFFGTHRT
jgi:hypothetical protein